MEIKKIVVGVDFSPESEVAVKCALNIGRHTGAEIVLVHVGTVLDQSRPVAPTGVVFEWEQVVAEQLADDRKRLDDMRRRFSGQGPEVSHMFIDGFPDTGLCEAAHELRADMIITGTHGRTGFKRILLGSVAERVVRLYERNVMVARGQIGANGFHRILVPTDFSPHAEDALKLAMVLANDGSSIELYHAWQLPAVASEVAGPVLASIAENANQAGEQLLQTYGRDGVELSFSTTQANPIYGISEKLQDGGYDLVVMGSHGRRGVRRVLLGSVAELVVRHATCSALVVHRPEES